MTQKRTRCWWCGDDPEYIRYHDTEWGRPQTNDRVLFEKVCLEGFQAGLSWITILKKRENFRKAFANFDFEKVARFSDSKVEKLLQNAKIVRHRGKIEATINNAQLVSDIVDEFGSLSNYFWSYEPDPRTRPKRMTEQIVRTLTTSKEAQALSKDLKKRGWKFVGETTMYSLMQAMGLVNDHVEGCFIGNEIQKERAKLLRVLG